MGKSVEEAGLHFDSSNSKEMEISGTIQKWFHLSLYGIPLSISFVHSDIS